MEWKVDERLGFLYCIPSPHLYLRVETNGNWTILLAGRSIVLGSDLDVETAKISCVKSAIGRLRDMLESLENL